MNERPHQELLDLHSKDKGQDNNRVMSYLLFVRRAASVCVSVRAHAFVRVFIDAFWWSVEERLVILFFIQTLWQDFIMTYMKESPSFLLRKHIVRDCPSMHE